MYTQLKLIESKGNCFCKFLVPILKKGVMSARFHLLGNWPSAKDLQIVMHIQMEIEPHSNRTPETNRQALETYKHLGPLTAFQSGVNGTIIDVRKLG